MISDTSRYETRQSLLRRIRSHEEQGWLDFYEKYTPLVRWLCHRKGLGDPDQVRLVIQSVMLHFAKLTWSYDDSRGRFRNLLLKVAELKIHEVKKECRSKFAGEPLNEFHVVPEPSDALELLGRQELLERALLLLCDDPEINSQHLWVFNQLLEGRTYDELMQVSGLSVANLKVIKHRLLLRLRAYLAQEGL